MRIIAGVLQLVGLIGLGYGLYQYQPWVAWTVCGSLLLIGGFVLDLTAPKPKVEP